MRATEFIVEGVAEGSLNEYRDQLWTWVQSKFTRTQWPEYVQRDFLYAKAKGNKNQKDLEDFLDEIQRDFGRVRWQLEKLPITLDVFTPKTQRMIQSREGGSSNPYQVPKDAERHSLQQKMIQQKGVSEEPIIVAKLSNGYDLIEGWHRTIQHLKEFPQGYTAPAWVGYGATYTSESVEQGVAEGLNESLSSLVAQDQSERNEYKNFVKSQAGGDWSKGAKMYAQLKKRPSNDIFGDATRLNQFMKMKFDFDKFTDEDWDNYWLLAQHCDDNRDFQKNALSIIKKYQGTDHSHYKYLYDRISMGLTGKQKYGTQNTKKQGVAEGFSNDMSTEDMIAYLRQHHDTNLHQDYLNYLNTFSKFVLKDVPTNTLKTDLPGLDREKVERYKKMDQSKAPPIVLGGKYILDGYHRANAVKELGIPTIKAYVGITTK